MGHTDVYLVFCTFPDPEKARQIGAALVERQVAACVNLLPSVESVYRWQGKVEQAQEVLAVIKTSRYAALEAAILELHPYDVPEILGVPVEAGLPSYLAWVTDSCR